MSSMNSDQPPNNPFDPPLEPSPTGPRPTLFTGSRITFWAISIVIILTLGVMLLPATRRSREPARRAQCQNNLKQIANALIEYQYLHGEPPPLYTVDSAGRPLHSWRTLLLPHLEEEKLYKQIDLTKPWDDPIHDDVRKAAVRVYACPSLDLTDGKTVYVANPQTWPRPNVWNRPDIASKDRLADYDSAEVLIFETDSTGAVQWMAPHDGDFAAYRDQPVTTLRPHGPIAHLITTDGQIIHTRHNPPATDQP